jgi:hypothetical protein
MLVECAVGPMRIPLLLITLALVVAQVATAETAAAQEAAPGCVRATGPDTTVTAASRGVARDTTRAALRIVASVTADEVRFERSPTICVRLTGDARLDSVRVVGRRNLASPVVAATTYRNVYVAVEILGHLDAQCIASRITGAPADTTARAGARCAALDARGQAGAGAPP